MSLRIAICGSSGRVGRELIRLINDSDQKFILAFELTKPLRSTRSLDLCDVVIDFSTPQAFEELLPLCAKEKKPIVSGTTGLSKSAIAMMAEIEKEIAILWAPNMSLGVAVMERMIESFAQLTGFDFQLEEIHHKRKIDSPSGTAHRLQECLQKFLKEKLPEPLSIRGGGVFGIHKFWAFSDEEILSVEHQALNRAVFAKGALSAAQWIKTRPPGRYSMRDVLGFN